MFAQMRGVSRNGKRREFGGVGAVSVLSRRWLDRGRTVRRRAAADVNAIRFVAGVQRRRGRPKLCWEDLWIRVAGEKWHGTFRLYRRMQWASQRHGCDKGWGGLLGEDVARSGVFTFADVPRLGGPLGKALFLQTLA